LIKFKQSNALCAVLVATFLGALELALDRGLEDDWFASSFIVEVAVVCAMAFVRLRPLGRALATARSHGRHDHD
jgi:hypothetical protein